MNKIVKNYIDGRIIAMEEYRSALGDEKFKDVVSIFQQLGPALEDVSNEQELKVAKREIKNCILEAMDVASIEDEKKRALTIQAIYNIVDYHHNNVNSIAAIKEMSKDMGMSVREYFAFAFRLAYDLAHEEEAKKGNSRSFNL